jgi:hypothetical protein
MLPAYGLARSEQKGRSYGIHSEADADRGLESGAPGSQWGAKRQARPDAARRYPGSDASGQAKLARYRLPRRFRYPG